MNKFSKRVLLFIILMGQICVASQISLNYRDADIDQVLQFFSLTSGKTIIKDPQVKGTVTIISQNKVSLEEGFAILKTILSLRGFTLIEDQNLTRVIPMEKAIGQGPIVMGSLPAESGGEKLVTQILPLKGLKAGELARELKSLFPSEACVVALESSNTLLLTDYESHLRQIEAIIAQLEASLVSKRPEQPRLEFPPELPFRVIRLEHLDAELLARQLSPLLTPPATALPQLGIQQQGRGATQQQTIAPQLIPGQEQGNLGTMFQQLTQAAQTRSGLVENQIVADTHTNSVIVTGSKQVLELISQIIVQIDIPVEEEESVRRVVRLKYANAQNAVNILNIIFGDSPTTRIVQPGRTSAQGSTNTQRGTSRGSASNSPQQLLQNLLQQRGTTSTRQTPSANAARQSTSANAPRFAADATTNSVVVTAPASIIEEIVALLQELDKESAGGTELQATAVIRLEKANAAQLADMLNQVLNLSYRWTAQGPSTVDKATLSEMLTGLGLDPETIFAWPTGTQVRVAADSASNSLVVTASLSAIAQLESLVGYLDQDGAPASSVMVHRLQNARASELAKTLNELFAATSSTGSRQQIVRNVGYSPMGMFPAGGTSRTSQGLQDQNIRVVADDVSNSLLVTATPQVLDEVKTLIAQLDVMPPQVLIEAVVMEVTLDESTDLGLELSFNLPGGQGKIGWGTNTGSGLRYSTLNGDVSAAIQALSQSSQVDILATPKIATANNKQASINIGHQFPYLTSSKKDENGQTQNFYTYKDVGIKLEVTPRICESGQIALDVFQTSNSFANDINVEGGKVIAQREAKTSVIVRDGETMVIGGMIKDDITQFTRKVPFLGEIPILGFLFRRQETVKRKTELVVFITPHIVRDDAPANVNIDKERMKGTLTGAQ